ncbi:MAG: uncharacterized protein QOK10_122 [Pseudonocardiales bacterium]|nr:uncharacterized protein [Pseudonocardiales bacterium]
MVTHASPLDLIVGAGAGVVAGWVNAVAGGGSLILYPALVGLGLPSVAANVTNSVALWPGYAGNIVGLGPIVRDNAFEIRRLTIPAVVGATAGCIVLLITPGRAFDVLVPFLVIAASLLLAAQPRLKDAVSVEHGQHPSTLLITTGLAAVYGGYFGGGLGVILLAVLGLTLGSGLRVANAIKGGLSLLINSVSVLIFALFGPVNWLLVAAIAPASLAGGLIGGRFAARIDERALRFVVVSFGLAVGVWLGIGAMGRTA